MQLAIQFRPLRPTDKPRVLEITRHTWGDDGDYIHEVFDDWVNDRTGEFTAAIVDDRVAGIAKLTELGEGEWWFEGLRVDPAHRRKGIAEAINRYQVDLARRLDGKVIRYMTGAENIGSQMIGFRAGFEHILTFAAHLADAAADFALPVPLTLNDVPSMVQWLHSPLMHYQYGVYRAGWSVRTLTEREIRVMIGVRRAYGLRDRQGRVTAWAALREESDDNEDDVKERRLRVDHLDGEHEAAIELAQALRALAAAQRCAIVSAGISDYPPLIDVVKEAGYRLNPDKFGLWVMELKL